MGLMRFLLTLKATFNAAVGVEALHDNTTGSLNTAVGFSALLHCTEGIDNTAMGSNALFFITTGDNNTALGHDAGVNLTTGNNNTALGRSAGVNLTTNESNNIDIGFNVGGVTGESNTIRIGNNDITDTFIRGISGTTIASGATVLVDSDGHLGTVTSSQRFKENIKPMDKASETLFSLKPITFRYKKEIDPDGTSQFGLVAEDVEKINPDLVVRDEKGQVNSVRYDQVTRCCSMSFSKSIAKCGN